MNIDARLVPVLNQINFGQRYKEICQSFSDFDNRLIQGYNQNLEEYFEEKRIKAAFVKSEKFYKIVDKANHYKTQLNIIPHCGFIQFVLDVKRGNERFKLGFGVWESITRELCGVEAKKPIFSSIKELKEILEEVFGIYQDFKTELENQS